MILSADICALRGMNRWDAAYIWPKQDTSVDVSILAGIIFILREWRTFLKKKNWYKLSSARPCSWTFCPESLISSLLGKKCIFEIVREAKIIFVLQKQNHKWPLDSPLWTAPTAVQESNHVQSWVGLPVWHRGRDAEWWRWNVTCMPKFWLRGKPAFC